ncbi:MAG: hypothetical protein VB100_04650 [Angelakisella sp.]|nr:hypothetical protein [Angelakisella sp.]
MRDDIIYTLRCSFTTSEDFTEDKRYPVFFSPGGDYVINDRRKRIAITMIDYYGDFVQE